MFASFKDFGPEGIDPIDDTLDDGDFDGWPRGNLSPLDTRQTPEGIEMRIGPDVVDAPLLEPGTPVTISVPDSKLSAELIWPDLPLSSSLSSAPVVMSPSQMAAEMAASDRAKTELANAAKAAKEAELAATARADAARAQAALAERARLEAARVEPQRVTKKPAVAAAPVADNATQQQRMAAAARELEAALALEPMDTKPGTLAKALDSMPAGNKAANDALANLAAANSGGDRPRSNNGATLSSLSKPAADRADPTLTATSDRDISLPTIMLKRSDAPGNPPSTIETSKLRRETIDGRLSPQSNPSRLMPFLAGAGAAGIALAALLAVTSLRSGSGVAPPVSGVQTATAASPKSPLADAFTVGTQSPRGEIATDVDLPTALRLADYNLHGVDRPIDRAEAEFWLKKAMSLTASHSQIRWAMTQLGTLSAEPVTGTPDYEKARLLWEISAANGDPVAMCFIGTLLESGLGIAADRVKALDQFKRARSAGGCPNSDEAIARLSK